jgi:tetraacyldisaccharide 4'-kinase
MNKVVLAVQRVVLRPLAGLFSLITRVRGWLYDAKVVTTYESRIPVVSIGNVTAGGNGKTPLCMYVAEELLARGLKPVILSRGYGGRLRGPRRVHSGDSPRLVGDEPVLMARSSSVPVYIARSRVAGARLIEKDGTGNVIVLDDGFQHRALAREVDIVSVFAGTRDAVDLFVAGELLPLGRFRENRQRALRRASIVVVAERRVVPHPEALPALDSRLLAVMPPGISVFRSYLEARGVVWLEAGGVLSPSAVVAFAGIANPRGFFDSLRELGFSLDAEYDFADHHTFSERDLKELMERHPGVPLVCTAKDAVKIRSMKPEIRERCAALDVKLKVTPADAFAVQIVRRIRGKLGL